MFVITLYEQYAFWGYCIYAQGDYFKKDNGLSNVFFPHWIWDAFSQIDIFFSKRQNK